MRGTHLGQFRDIPPSGRSDAVRRIDTFRFEGERIAEVQAFLDHQAFFAELREGSSLAAAPT
jgi:predicted ester cyclase